MSKPKWNHQSPTGQQTNDVVQVASHLVGRDEIGAIHVVTQQRPTYDDLLRYHQMADANDMTLVVEADAVVLRPARSQNVADSELATSPVLQLTPQTHFPRAVWHWVRDHAAAVIALFAGFTEGVR